jgi:ectonucleotide pyrophosphatase/phosphodiesterase family protein 4
MGCGISIFSKGAHTMRRAIHLTVLCLCLQSASPAPVPAPSGVAPLLIISFDGFRASYLDQQPRASLPNLNAFWEEGGVRASITPRFVSKTFPNHYSLVTGLNEENHGVLGKGGEG